MTSTPPSPAPAPQPPPVQDARATPPRAQAPAAPAPVAASPVKGVWRRGLARLSGGPGRILGLDVARGLAILGMFVAHLYAEPPSGGPGAIPWSWMLDGRSSILFATLAGISLAIMSGRSRPVEAVPALQVRMRIVVRAMLIFAIGEVLTMLGTPVAVILQSYAVLFVLSLPLLRWTARRLFALAALCSVVLPLLAPVLIEVLSWAQLGYVPLADLLLTGMYPGVVWFTFVVLGLAIGRCELDRRTVQLWLLGAGATIAALAYGLALAVGTGTAAIDLGKGGDGSWPEHLAGTFRMPDLAAVARAAHAHSGGVLEVIGSGAVAMAVVGACLLVSRWLWWVLVPVAAVGSMALTAYSVHIVALWRIGEDYWERTGPELLVSFVVVTLVGCTLWRFFLGRGPLERLLTWVSWRAASISPRPRPGQIGRAHV